MTDVNMGNMHACMCVHAPTRSKHVGVSLHPAWLYHPLNPKPHYQMRHLQQAGERACRELVRIVDEEPRRPRGQPLLDPAQQGLHMMSKVRHISPKCLQQLRHCVRGAACGLHVHVHAAEPAGRSRRQSGCSGEGLAVGAHV